MKSEGLELLLIDFVLFLTLQSFGVFFKKSLFLYAHWNRYDWFYKEPLTPQSSLQRHCGPYQKFNGFFSPQDRDLLCNLVGLNFTPWLRLPSAEYF